MFLQFLIATYIVASIRGVLIFFKVEHALAKAVDFPYWEGFTPLRALQALLALIFLAWAQGVTLLNDKDKKEFADDRAQHAYDFLWKRGHTFPPGTTPLTVRDALYKALGVSS